jgi:hypothetical protein
MSARLQRVWAYDTDLFATRPIAWARANGLAGAVGRYCVRGCACGRRRVLARRRIRSTPVDAFGLRRALAAAEMWKFILILGQLPPAMASPQGHCIRRGKRTSTTRRDLGALRKIAMAARWPAGAINSCSRTVRRRDQYQGQYKCGFIWRIDIASMQANCSFPLTQRTNP